ncbi:hypothetical protein JTE90_008313 [Oedothorax gibbosus]|uniref:Uncharacterized protein n=1 Tax=Oedothorax gibbosus TaxID=931172 RepID=A0AAV6TUJ0_9ARAC|nr:hypothetical protein JTE90_008313 [Oedothorax gibbosus]
MQLQYMMQFMKDFQNLGYQKKFLCNGVFVFVGDEAAVNFGVRNGIATKLQEDIQWMIKVHCAGHRIELALKDVAKTIEIQKKGERLIPNIYLFNTTRVLLVAVFWNPEKP